MTKLLRVISLIFIFFWAILVLGTDSASAAQVVAPHIVSINDYNSSSLQDPIVTGLTKAGTDVMIYVNDEFLAYAEINSKETETDNFFYQIKDLKEGSYTVYAIAVERDSLVRSEKSTQANFSINTLAAPTLVVPNQDTITSKPKQLIEGFTVSASMVHVYIDGVYNGKTDFREHKSGTAHFAYTPFLNLSVGEHVMWAVAEDKNGRKSKVSKSMRFRIEDQFPAPSLFAPEFIAGPDYNKPVFKGLAKNNSKIKVYIDQKYDGEFKVENHKSGTANFAYRPSKALSDDHHFLYMVAIDPRGKESIWSELVYFEVYKSKPLQTPIISDEAVVEAIPDGTEEEMGESPDASNKSNGDVKIDVRDQRVQQFLDYAKKYSSDKSIRLSGEDYKELESIIYNIASYDLSDLEKRSLETLLESKDIEISEDERKNADEVEASDMSLEEILSSDLSTSSDEQGGAINEDKESQGKLGWNALIFLLFLLAVIAWIFWVNRELIKERKELEKENEENK